MKKTICILGIGLVLFECGLVLATTGTPTDEPKIEPQEISIIGKDRSALEEEEEEIIMRPRPRFLLEPPAYTVREVEPPKIKPKPILPDIEEMKKTLPRDDEKLPKPTLYSFGLAYGSDETLLYDFTHTNETKEVGYYFRVDRSRSDGFTYNNISPFKKFSQDNISGETITHFEKWSLRTGLEYLNKDLTLPYQDKFVENKLKKALSMSYEVKIPPESNLSFGLDIARGDIFSKDWGAKNNFIGVHLGYYTPFKKGSPPLAIGTKVYQERLEGKGTLVFDKGDKKLEFHSLYAEGRGFRITSQMHFDAKVALNEYKNGSSESQLDFLFKLHYLMKENLIILSSIEQKLFLDTFDELYINNDYSGINPAVEPERSVRCKMTANYRISNEVFLEGSIFTQQTEEYIIWTTELPSSKYIYKPGNIDKATFSGLEFELRYYFSPKLSQNIRLSYTSAKNKSDGGGVIPHVPKSRLKMGLRYKDNERLTVDLNAEYVGSTYASADRNAPKLDSYFLVNLIGEKKINENLFYSFSCENLLDEEYQYLLGYPGQKRRLAVGVRLRF